MNRYGSDGDSAARDRSGGWVLLEVLVAMAIAGLFIGPLTVAVVSTSALTSRARETLRGVDTSLSASNAHAAWEWGESTLRVGWLPGPILSVETRPAGEDDDVQVGVWANGWLRGTWPVGTESSSAIGRLGWRAQQGEEVVVRVRQGSSGWGPPWRTVVPGPDGQADNVVMGSGDEGEVAIHVPMAAEPSVEFSGTATPLTLEISSPLVYPAGLGEVGSVILDGGRQSWNVDLGRSLDVYF